MTTLETLFDIAGKNVVITGSTRGIGLGLAAALSELGATVWVHGRSRETVRSVAERIGGHGLTADLGVPADLDRMIEDFAAVSDRLDVLINNAGLEVIEPLGSLSRENLEATLQVNLVAPVLLTQGFLPYLRKSGSGSVINVTSIHEEIPYPHNAAYSVSKAALAMFTRTAALELAGDGIRVNNLAPGAIETDINRELIDELGRGHFEDWIPARRLGTVEDLVAAVVALASSGTSYATGGTVVVDGGYRHNLLRYRP